MTAGSLYVLLALAVLTGALWGAIASTAWTRHRENRPEPDELWTDADYDWLDSQSGEP